MIVKKLLRTWFCLFLYILLVFFCITGAAEGQDEKKDWVEQALKAYDAQDYETSLYYFTLLADAGDPYAQYITASHYFFSCTFMPMTGMFLKMPSDGTGIGGRLAVVAWCVYFLPVGVLAYRHFGGQHRKS